MAIAQASCVAEPKSACVAVYDHGWIRKICVSQLVEELQRVQIVATGG